MQRSAKHVLASMQMMVAVATLLLAPASSATAAPRGMTMQSASDGLGAIARDLTPDEVRSAYLNAGQVVGNAAVSEGGAIAFAVSDPSDGPQGRPILRVAVYPTAAAAVAEHQHADGRDEANRSRSVADSDDRGPQLLTGYGLSVWRQNVSLIQSAPSDDVGAWPIEVDCGLDPTSQEAILPRTTVDSQYVATLETLLGSYSTADQ